MTSLGAQLSFEGMGLEAIQRVALLMIVAGFDPARWSPETLKTLLRNCSHRNVFTPACVSMQLRPMGVALPNLRLEARKSK